MGTALGIGMICIGIIVLIITTTNMRKIEGFNWMNGGSNLLYIAITFVSIGIYIVYS